MYRCLIDGLFGLQGCHDGIRIEPKIPSDWEKATIKRTFRGATLNTEIIRSDKATKTEVYVNDVLLENQVFTGLQAGVTYNVLVKLPV
ncbi:hypothetical protein D3C77_747420 [compost metagenome]